MSKEIIAYHTYNNSIWYIYTLNDKGRYHGLKMYFDNKKIIAKLYWNNGHLFQKITYKNQLINKIEFFEKDSKGDRTIFYYKNSEQIHIDFCGLNRIPEGESIFYNKKY